MAEQPDTLRSTLLLRFRDGIDRPMTDAEFDGLALAAFRYNFERCAPYAAYCRRRGRTPGGVHHWTDVPAVPTAAFKEIALTTGPTADAERVFSTSGTTGGRERRGRHFVLDLDLYDGSLLPNFAGHLLPDGARPVMLSLVPHPTDWPDSSLAYMVGRILEHFGAERSAVHAHPERGLDMDGLDRDLGSIEAESRPVCLLGTSVAFIHWLDRLGREGRRYRLPDGSRLMDTGGYKGRGTRIAEPELRAAYVDRLAIPESHAVNEYGMTELLSQYYDASLRDAAAGRTAPRRKVGPPWIRHRVVDPETLAPVPEGEAGILQHFDLANLDSVCAVQTEDTARRVDDGFLLLGRATGAPPRGCSIAMDLLMRALQDRG